MSADSSTMRPDSAAPSISDGASNHAVATPSTTRQSVPISVMPGTVEPMSARMAPTRRMTAALKAAVRHRPRVHSWVTGSAWAAFRLPSKPVRQRLEKRATDRLEDDMSDRTGSSDSRAAARSRGWRRPAAFAVAGVLAGGALAGTLNANASSSDSTSSATSDGRHGNGRVDESKPQRSDETLLTG